jgi:uncharacterized membrane protein (DUF4010 family)
LIGTERERRKGTGPERSAAGLRTFTLASLTGAVSFIVGGAPLLAVTTAGIFGLAALGYWRRVTDDPGLTTEVALVSATVLGGFAVARPGLAAGIAVAIAIVLNARTALHRFARSVLSEDEIRDALIFAAATLIVLPILPNQPMGPFSALNPSAIWIIVILVMAISALGHIAVRLAGARYGLPIAGFASGFISSAATVAAMGARAATQPELLWPAAAGAIFPRLRPSFRWLWCWPRRILKFCGLLSFRLPLRAQPLISMALPSPSSPCARIRKEWRSGVARSAQSRLLCSGRCSR